MSNATPKAKRKVARDLIDQIDHLTARWHLDFSTVERNVIRNALVTYVTIGRPRHPAPVEPRPAKLTPQSEQRGSHDA